MLSRCGSSMQNPRSRNPPDEAFGLQARLASHNSGANPHTAKDHPWGRVCGISFQFRERAADILGLCQNNFWGKSDQVVILTFIPASAMLFPMSLLLQTGSGMFLALAGRGRPGCAEKRFLIN